MEKITNPLSRRVAPDISILALTVAAALFIFASLFLGEALGFYPLFWWWDDMLHLTSGIILALASVLIIYSIDPQHARRITPLFTVLFAFFFAIGLGVLWEVLEFALDALIGWNTQRWNTSSTAFMLGHSFQGSGLRDTMSDLIYNTIGAVIASFYLYFNTKKNRIRPTKQ